MYPPKLEAIINLFESLPEDERRETLVSYADNAKRQEPRPGEKFVLEDVRKDEECTDTVGVYLQVDDEGKAHFRMTLGPEVQTLTRAMTAILCKSLDGQTPQEVLGIGWQFRHADRRGGAGPGAQPDCVLRADSDQRRLHGVFEPATHGGVVAAVVGALLRKRPTITIRRGY